MKRWGATRWCKLWVRFARELGIGPYGWPRKHARYLRRWERKKNRYIARMRAERMAAERAAKPEPRARVEEVIVNGRIRRVIVSTGGPSRYMN